MNKLKTIISCLAPNEKEELLEILMRKELERAKIIQVNIY